MMLSEHQLYVFDSHLDDSQPWETGLNDCPDCGRTFAYVRRVDRADPSCPRCVPSDRWTAKSIYTN